MLVSVVQYLYACAAWLFGRRYYSGPVPTKDEHDDNSRWITGYLQRWPNSPLARKYKQQAARAHAYRAYLKLQERHESGMIDEIDYQRELARILPLIDVQNDIARIQEKA
jgi:hypothetical protein